MVLTIYISYCRPPPADPTPYFLRKKNARAPDPLCPAIWWQEYAWPLRMGRPLTGTRSSNIVAMIHTRSMACMYHMHKTIGKDLTCDEERQRIKTYATSKASGSGFGMRDLQTERGENRRNKTETVADKLYDELTNRGERGEKSGADLIIDPADEFRKQPLGRENDAFLRDLQTKGGGIGGINNNSR